MSTFSNIFPLKPLGRLKPNFIWSLLGKGEQKYVQAVLVTWPRWPPCPYMVKTLKNLLLRNQKVNDLETWYAALAAQVLPSLFKRWPWVDPDGKVKFGSLCFCMGKGKTMGSSETVVVYDIIVGKCSQLNESFIPKVKVIHWPWSKSLRFNIFKLLFLNNRWF